MHGGHETFNDLEVVVDDLGERSQAVGSAGGVGYDLVAGVVAVKVDTAHVHGSVSRRSRDDDFLCATLQVSLPIIR